MEHTLGDFPNAVLYKIPVLILVLMEHTLGGPDLGKSRRGNTVLILVLMEHTLGGNPCTLNDFAMVVLILVLMEHTLGVKYISELESAIEGLNPCFNGTYSRSRKDQRGHRGRVGLNPCFNGTYSRRATFTTYTISKYYACKFGIFICFLQKKCTSYTAKI